MHIFIGSNEDDNGGADNADKEDNFQQPHAEDGDEHGRSVPRMLSREKSVTLYRVKSPDGRLRLL